MKVVPSSESLYSIKIDYEPEVLPRLTQFALYDFLRPSFLIKVL